VEHVERNPQRQPSRTNDFFFVVAKNYAKYSMEKLGEMELGRALEKSFEINRLSMVEIAAAVCVSGVGVERQCKEPSKEEFGKNVAQMHVKSTEQDVGHMECFYSFE